MKYLYRSDPIKVGDLIDGQHYSRAMGRICSGMFFALADQARGVCVTCGAVSSFSIFLGVPYVGLEQWK